MLASSPNELHFRKRMSDSGATGRTRPVRVSRPGALVGYHQWHPATLLVYLRTGARPSKYALNLLGMVAAGSATWEEVRPILEDRARERDLDRRRLAHKRAGPGP